MWNSPGANRRLSSAITLRNSSARSPGLAKPARSILSFVRAGPLLSSRSQIRGSRGGTRLIVFTQRPNPDIPEPHRVAVLVKFDEALRRMRLVIIGHDSV